MVLPQFFKLIVNLCLHENSTVVLYYLEPLSIVSKIEGERVSCSENYTASLLQTQPPSCSTNRNYFYFFCEATLISKSSASFLCLTISEFGLNTFGVKCSSLESWKFYADPLFSKYGIYILYAILGALIVLITFIMNFVILFAVATSKSFKSLNTVVYAVHMALIDLLLALSAQPMYLSLLVISQENWFHGYQLASEKVYKSISNWYDHIDFILINAQFANLAVLSAERCIAIFKPFFHLQSVTYVKCICSLAFVWVYTMLIYGIHFYAIEKQKAIYISFVLAYGIPTLVMISTYVIIIYEVRKAKKCSTNSSNSHRNQQMAVTIKLVKLIVVFLACWIPFFISFMLQLRSASIEVIIANKWTKLLSYCHCFLDPILYSISHAEIRKEVRKNLLKIIGTADESKGNKISMYATSTFSTKKISNRSILNNTVIENTRTVSLNLKTGNKVDN